MTEESQNEEGHIDLDKYEGHTPIRFWEVVGQGEPEETTDSFLATSLWHIPYWMSCNKAMMGNSKADRNLIQDAPLLLEEVKRLRKALHVEEQIVQAFYEYRMECCFDHCEAWMLEKGHRVLVKTGDDEHSEWAVEMD